MKLKDLLGISLVSIFLFPVILIGVMFAAGVVHIEFGDGKDKERIRTGFQGADLVRQEEAEAKQIKAFRALEIKEKQLREKEAEVNVEIERLENLKLETARAKEEIEENRRKIEALVGKSSEIQDKQIASLADVYGAMRPDEAAPILLSLDNAMVVRIMKKIPETRSTSKLMASLAALDVKRAAEITRLLGGRNQSEKNRSEVPAEAGKVEPASEKKDAATKAPRPDGEKDSNDGKTDSKKGAPGKA